MINKHNPKCPYCEYEFDSEDTWYSDEHTIGKVYVGDGDESELICPNSDCGKKFNVVCDHILVFESSIEEPEEE